jgi:hypothetical protein
MGEKRKAYRLLVGKPEGKRPLGRPRCKWADNIKMDLGERGWGGVERIGLVQDTGKWKSSCECGNEPSEFHKMLGIYTTGGLSSSAQIHSASFCTSFMNHVQTRIVRPR